MSRRETRVALAFTVERNAHGHHDVRFVRPGGDPVTLLTICLDPIAGPDPVRISVEASSNTGGSIGTNLVIETGERSW